METKLIKYGDLGGANYGWLNAHHHFSFGGYYDNGRMGFGNLRVINDDIIESNTGFGMHPHKDMEIITFVRQGAITHRDNLGNEGRTVAGDVQVMSAGTGISHSEYNLENEKTNIYQIWIVPKETGLPPRWETKSFRGIENNTFIHLVGHNSSGKDVAKINQHADIYCAHLDFHNEVRFSLTRDAYILASEGTIEVSGDGTGVNMEKGDGLEVCGSGELNFKATSDNVEILLITV